MLQRDQALLRGARIAAIAALVIGIFAGAAPTGAAEAKSERTNGKFVSYDAAAGSIVVKEAGKEQPYQVKAEGSVLTRTTLTMNGKVAQFEDLKPGMVVIVYWRPDAADAATRVARKIDVPKIPKEFQQDVDDAE